MEVAKNASFSSPPPSPSSSSSSNKGIFGTTGGGVLFVAIIVFFCFRRYRKRSGKKSGKKSGKNSGKKSRQQASPTQGSSVASFKYEELEAATGGFSSSNLLGEGGFGCVYKGYLPGERVVAVKQLKADSRQGEREFQTELEIIGRIHHRNLVSLVGYCIAEDQRLLVYDYVPNGTLEHHLHRRGMPVMDWGTRLKIAVGAARGLAYLHEDCHPMVIHRDIKASNMLLDCNFEVQVSDFGLAKLAPDAYTHLTTRVMGTFGYLAPEYAATGNLTDRSDVYSFGVVLLELITGRKPVDTSMPMGEESLVEWSRPLFSKVLKGSSSLDDIVDQRLLLAYNEKEMRRMVEAAAACVRHTASRRPKMVQVARALEDDGGVTDLTHGLSPGQSIVLELRQQTVSEYSGLTSEYSRPTSKYSGPTSEYSGPTSEYSGPMSECSLNASPSSSEAINNSWEIEKQAAKEL